MPKTKQNIFACFSFRKIVSLIISYDLVSEPDQMRFLGKGEVQKASSIKLKYSNYVMIREGVDNSYLLNVT